MGTADAHFIPTHPNSINGTVGLPGAKITIATLPYTIPLT